MAGGAALNTALGAARISRDLDLFHDRKDALSIAWDEDRRALIDSGYTVEVVRERPTFVEALVRSDINAVLVQWTVDSAYRFFPLLENPDLGLTLHPFDLATNKILALVGRLEVRDFVDTITASERLQPLGYLVWAACGKDPGLNPELILSEAHRSARYLDADLATLEFDGPTPNAAELSRKFRAMLAEAADVISTLPTDHAGRCVLTQNGDLFKGGITELRQALLNRDLRFHAGRLFGAWPTLQNTDP